MNSFRQISSLAMWNKAVHIAKGIEASLLPKSEVCENAY
jgi:hypothetical protein